MGCGGVSLVYVHLLCSSGLQSKGMLLLLTASPPPRVNDDAAAGAHHPCVRKSDDLCVGRLCVCVCMYSERGAGALIHAAFEPKSSCLLALAGGLVGLVLGGQTTTPPHPPIQIRSPVGHNPVHPGVKHTRGHLEWWEFIPNEGEKQSNRGHREGEGEASEDG